MEHSYLRRLSPVAYQGLAQIHWTLTIDQRKQGWLTEKFHFRFRELLTHTCFLYQVTSPIYCLMPDHLHLLWLGYHQESDQRKGMRFLRRNVNRVLESTGHKLQKQPYDHVLRDAEKQPDALMDLASYIRNNPVRAELVEDSRNYQFTSCLIPGYPELDIHSTDYWTSFWNIYAFLQKQP